ncbi:MAG TPA: HAD family phosphatase [Woeseiaceae bacterium]|nr:HAD family phosphatase [Woeseiaceae bacterium]
MNGASAAGWDAVFFDMDGTLIDSEPLAATLVKQLLDQRNLPAPPFPLSRFDGQTWASVEAILAEHYPALAGLPLADRFEREFHDLLRRELPPAIPGAREAFTAAAQRCAVGIVSSSPRATIQVVADSLGLSAQCRVIVGAEDVRHSKPHPEAYLLAAERAQVAPRKCLVFEDSEAGLQAARAAGMTVVAIRGNRAEAVAAALSQYAHTIVASYADLPPDFLDRRG